jgi:hypothetical protein
MIDRVFNRIGIGLALFFMVSELSYVNAKSLLYLVQESGSVDRFFAITGSLAFSMVTIVVMRKSTERWIKIVFPLFDVALVFCGFNLKFADAIIEGSDNPVRFWLTVFMASFTGFITYSLGIINYNEHSGVNQLESNRITDESQLNQIESDRINNESSLNQDESNRIIDDLHTKQIESNRIIEELTAKQNDTMEKLNETKRILAETKVTASGFLRNHILYESWLGKKKSQANRNGYESLMDQLAERVKHGEAISLDEYFKNAKQ